MGFDRDFIDVYRVFIGFDGDLNGISWKI